MAGFTPQLLAAKLVSVADLEQLLAAAHGQSDGKVANQLWDLQLTERASSARLAQWETEFPGRRCHEALTELADASAFLALPQTDIPAHAPPDEDAQKAMLARTVRYVDSVISRLPNFYATRRTERFEDSPAHPIVEAPNAAFASATAGHSSFNTGKTEDIPMHEAGTSSVTVSYRDGFELRASKKVDFTQGSQSDTTLDTAGEFGPILSVVVDDAMHGQIDWDHWERNPAGLARNAQAGHALTAVFRYTVPPAQSNYSVAIPHGNVIDRIFPAYHGEIAIDPDNGNILRITVNSDLVPPHQLVSNSIAVEYDSISIGGANYICPLKSVALSRSPVFAVETWTQKGNPPVRTQLNDVAFIDYHVFRSESRIITGDSVKNDQPPAPQK